MRDYWQLMRFDKPVGIFLLLWPTLWGLWIAGQGKPDVMITVVFMTGVIIMRAAGCVINDIADRHFDSHVTRTQKRPLATKTIHVKQALLLFIFLCTIAFALVLLLNPLCLLFALLALATAIIYPFLKRITHLPQLALGMAFSFGIPMAFVALNGQVSINTWILFAANIAWTVAYDTQYAMVDRTDDLQIGIKSSAILVGHWDIAMITALQLITLTLLIVLGWCNQFNLEYYIGIGIAAILACYQQHLILSRDPKCCLKAFSNNVWFGGAIFAGIALQYLT